MNSTIHGVLSRLRDLMARYTPTQKKNMALTAVFLLIAILATTWVATRPHYVTIMAGLDNKSLGQVQTQLQTLKIPNEIQGASVLVPASQADTARAQLAVAGVPETGQIGYANVPTSPIGETDQVFSIQVLNALQQDLDNTIQNMNGIESARVYIVEPQQALFVTQTPTGAKASVFVQVAPGAQLSASQVAGIQTLVAHSVSGMSTSDVAVVDQNGVTLSTADSSGLSTNTSSEIDTRQALERTLQNTISSELNQILGYGNAVVAVNEDVSFNQVSTQSTKYLPQPGQQTGLIASQQKTSQSTTTPNGSVGGVVGQSSSNPGLPTYSGTTGGNAASTSQNSSSTTNYDNGRLDQQVVGDPMQIRGIDVSVLLNSNDKGVTPAVVSQIRQFVAGATGSSSPATKTFISVSSVPFQVNQMGGTGLTQSGQTVPLWGYAAGALALVGGTALVVRRRKRTADALDVVDSPLNISAMEDELTMMATTEDEQMRDQLVRLANQKPDEFVNLLRTWLVSE